jgi:hypothetical protein
MIKPDTIINATPKLIYLIISISSETSSSQISLENIKLNPLTPNENENTSTMTRLANKNKTICSVFKNNSFFLKLFT